MSNGTIADGREVLAACLVRLHLGQRQVVRSLTRSGLQTPADERMLSYLRENLAGLEEEMLTDFLTENGPKPEEWETGSREQQAIALSPSPIYNPSMRSKPPLSVTGSEVTFIGEALDRHCGCRFTISA